MLVVHSRRKALDTVGSFVRVGYSDDKDAIFEYIFCSTSESFVRPRSEPFLARDRERARANWSTRRKYCSNNLKTALNAMHSVVVNNKK